MTLTREIHSLKGAAAALCAVELSRRAARIEVSLRRDETLVHVDVAPLTEAFDTWCAAVHAPGVAEAIAA